MKYLLLFFISFSLFSQHLSLDKREEYVKEYLLNKNIKEKVITTLSFIFSQDEIIEYLFKNIKIQYENGNYSKKIIKIINILMNDEENNKIIKRIISNQFKSEEFKKSFLKIIKKEKNNKEILKKFEEFLLNKIKKDKTAERIILKLLEEMLVCTKNKKILFNSFSLMFYNQSVLNSLNTHFSNHVFTEEQQNAYKQRIISLPYTHTVENYLTNYMSKTSTLLTDFFTKEKIKQYLIDDKLNILFKNMLENLFNDDDSLNEFKKYILNILSENEIIISNFLFDLITKETFELNIDKTELKCFTFKEEYFKFNENEFSAYLLDFISKNTAFENEIMPLIFKYIK